MRRFAIMVAALLGLAACRDEVAQAQVPSEKSCGAQALQTLVGQNKSVLAGMRFAQPVRIIGPNSRVTMDYSASRLNIDVDSKGKITRVHCG